MRTSSYQDDPVIRKARSGGQLESLIDATGELEWTCPHCLYRNSEEPGDMWTGSFEREGTLETYCGECGRDQNFDFDWSPTFTPVVMGEKNP